MEKLHAVNEIQLNFFQNQSKMQQTCTLVVSFDKSKQNLHGVNEIQLMTNPITYEKSRNTEHNSLHT
jgi:hypothetical protein